MRKKLLVSFIFFLLVAMAAVYFCNRVVERNAQGKLYSDVQTIPYRKAGLLLGTGKVLSNGTENPYYTYRIQAATAVMKAGKIKYLIISGDNGRKDYNEPQSMRADLIAAGIDSNLIYLDYAGFRTFDSMVRLREIFGQDSATVISQPFHNERALYIASQEGIVAIGFNAKDVGARKGLKVQARERLARIKLFIDYLIGNEPRFLGPKVNLPS